jgi:hypothetical protein
MPETKVFTGKGVLSLQEYLNAATGSGVGKPDLLRLYSAVSWLYRGIALLENGIASMPFEIRRGKDAIFTYNPNSGKQDFPPAGFEWFLDIPHLSGMVNGAGNLLGKAYIGNIRNRKKTLRLQWYIPTSVEPVYDSRGEVVGFSRTINGVEKPKEIEDIIYFWYPDKTVENEPAKVFPGKAALTGARVIHAMDEFLTGYFDRGMIKAGLLKYQTPMQPDEKERVKEWWKRLMGGIRGAHNSEIVRGDFTYQEIGNGLKELENSALTIEQREAIATALGIPQSKLTQPPGGLGNTKTPDDMAFVTDTLIPQCNWISREWNQHFFIPNGLMLVYTPQKLPIMQQDENERSIAFRNYVGSGGSPGYSVPEAEAILGIHLPEEIREIPEPELPAISPPPQPEPEPEPQLEPDAAEKTISAMDLVEALQKADEIKRFHRWINNRRGEEINPADFESDVLTLQERQRVLQKAVEKINPSGGIPAGDFGNEPTSEEIANAIADWDATMPDFRGLLDADIVEE